MTIAHMDLQVGAAERTVSCVSKLVSMKVRITLKFRSRGKCPYQSRFCKTFDNKNER